MDRFKFRVWDNKEKSYFFFDNEWTIDMNGELCFRNKPRKKDYLILEQCTGLKDTKGYLVFEGDIVKDENGQIGIIRFDVSSAMFSIEYSKNDWEFCDMLKDHEIIGTIHDSEVDK